MDLKTSEWLLKPGANGSIILIVESAKADEDGSRARFEVTLSRREAMCLADGIGLALLGQWVES